MRDGDVRAVRRLTPPGGARELLPGRYAYTLPAGTLRGLPRGRYAFRAVARAPARRPRRDRGLGGLRRPMRTVTLYGRPDCHLCDEARAALERVRATHPFALAEVDIEADDELFKRYLERIPVVVLDGEELFDFFVDEEALRAELRAAL